MLTINPASRLILFLKLVAFHSLAVGISLIFIPPQYLKLFGFQKETTCFFQIQGGVFHIVMFVAYFLASINLPTSSLLIRFIIIAKTMALIFLLIYFIYIETILVIFLSAIGDGLMALLIFIFYKQYLYHIGDTHG